MIIFEKQFNQTYTVMDQSWLGATMMSTMSLGSKFRPLLLGSGFESVHLEFSTAGVPDL